MYIPGQRQGRPQYLFPGRQEKAPWGRKAPFPKGRRRHGQQRGTGWPTTGRPVRGKQYPVLSSLHLDSV